MRRRKHFHWNFFPGHFWGMRFGFGPMMGFPFAAWRRRPSRTEELEWLEDYLEELQEMKEELEEEIAEVQQRIEELKDKT
ncbi:hypothetical protein ACX8XP_07255 [Calditrichota bacterium LG25]